MKFVVFCILLVLSLPGLTQEESPTRPEDLPQRVQIINSDSPGLQNPSGAPSEPAIPSDYPDEMMTDEILHAKAQSAKMAVDLNNTNEQVTEKTFNGPEELAKIGYGAVDAAALLDQRVIKIIQKMFESSTLKGASRKEIVNLINEKLKGQPWEDFLKNNPRLIYAFADIMRDDKAMPALIGILGKRDELKTYFFIWLSLMIVGMLIKRFYFKKQKKWSSSKQFLMGLGLSLLITTTSFSIFYNIFQEELGPAGKILVTHWRKRNLPIEL